jgi:RNA polymerase sigma-70 factor (ECF subfamily)
VGETAASDERAVKSVLEGDTGAFEVLVRAHQERLFRLLSRHLPRSDVAEAAQETLIDAFVNLSKLREPSRFGSWLSAIALRRAADYWRENAKRRERGVDFSSQEEMAWLEEAMAEDSADRFDELCRREEAARLAELLMEELSPEDRIVVELYYAGEYGVAEIAGMMGWGEPKVKVRLHRARKKMARRHERMEAREREAARGRQAPSMEGRP